MAYVKVVGGVGTQFSFRQFQSEHSDKSFPVDYFETASNADLNSYGIYRATDIERPTPSNEFTHKVVRKSPELVGDAWQIGWDMLERSEDEKIDYSEAQANWDAFNFGLPTVTGYLAWKNTLEASPLEDGHYFKILQGALTVRNLRGMQAAYNATSNTGKPPQVTRLQLQDLAENCNIYINFLLEGDRL